MVSPAFLDVTIAPATAQQRIQQRSPLVAAIAQQSATLVQQQSAAAVSCSSSQLQHDLEPLIAAMARKRTRPRSPLVAALAQQRMQQRPCNSYSLQHRYGAAGSGGQNLFDLGEDTQRAEAFADDS